MEVHYILMWPITYLKDIAHVYVHSALSSSNITITVVDIKNYDVFSVVSRNWIDHSGDVSSN